jgi:hypothetical protein
MPHGYPIGMGEAEPVRVREGGRWSDIMAAPLDDSHDDPDQPLVLEGWVLPGEGVIDLAKPECTCMWCERRRAES